MRRQERQEALLAANTRENSISMSFLWRCFHHPGQRREKPAGASWHGYWYGVVSLT